MEVHEGVYYTKFIYPCFKKLASLAFEIKCDKKHKKIVTQMLYITVLRSFTFLIGREMKYSKNVNQLLHYHNEGG